MKLRKTLFKPVHSRVKDFPDPRKNRQECYTQFRLMLGSYSPRPPDLYQLVQFLIGPGDALLWFKKANG